MPSKKVICSLLCLAAAVLVVGHLLLWIYLPMSGKSSLEIADALLDYRNVTATNGHGALGTELPKSLILYNDWNPGRESGPDFADTCYYYFRLGIYFERSFALRRDLPGGNTWTLTSTVRACPPGIQREFWWTQHLITITNGPSTLPPSVVQNNKIPDDAGISKGLPGTWRITEWATANGWSEKVNVASNGDFSGLSLFADTIEESKNYGRISVENGFLVMTITNQIAPLASKVPCTSRQRILYADSQRILVSADPLPEKMLLQRELK